MLKPHKNHLRKDNKMDGLMTVSDFYDMYKDAIENGKTSTEINRIIFECMCDKSIRIIDSWGTVIDKIDRLYCLNDTQKKVVLGIIFAEIGKIFPDYCERR